jgi:hypothetical protein
LPENEFPGRPKESSTWLPEVAAVRRIALFLILAGFLSGAVRAQLVVADDVNGAFSPGFYIFDPTLRDVGWYYTPAGSYRLVRIESKFRGFTNRPEDVDRDVTFNVYTDRPSEGGQLLASETFSTSLGRGFFIGSNLNQPVDLQAGTRYFIGLLNISGLGVNMYDWHADGNDCNLDPGQDNLEFWATSSNSQLGVFDTLFGPELACPYNPFAGPILQFLTNPDPTPTPSPTPTPTPPPTPAPCEGDSIVPDITGADLPFTQTVATPANQPDLFLGVGSDDNSPDAFWYFTPSEAGKYWFSMTGYDIVMSQLDGSCCDPLLRVRDDNNYGGETRVRDLIAGQRVLLAGKGDVLGDVGRLTLEIEGPIQVPPNDACANATVVTLDGSVYYEEVQNALATDTFSFNPSQEPSPTGLPAATPDLFWRFTPQVNGKYEIRAVGLLMDLIIGVFTGECGSLTKVASIQTPAFGYYGEHLVLDLTAGTPYTIVVEGASAADVGKILFTVFGPRPPTSNAACAGATIIEPASLPYDQFFDTTFNPSLVDGSAANDGTGGGSPDAWWSFTPAQTGEYVLGLRAADSPDPTLPDLSLIDEVLTVYTGACGNLTEVVSRNQISYGEMVILTLQAGVTYTILTEGYSHYADFGLMRFYLDGPAAPTANDTCAGAIAIPPASLPYENTVNTLGNTDTLTPTASSDFGGGGAPDAYYTFTPTVGGVYTFEVDLSTGGLGADIDVTLAVFSGPCGGLTEIGSVDEGDGLSYTPERVAVDLTAGTQYTILVDGYQSDDRGPLTLRADGPFFPSANDRCAGGNASGDWTVYR